MSNEQNNFENNINKNKRNNVNINQDTNEQLNDSENLYNEQQFGSNYKSNDEIEEVKKRKQIDKHLKGLGIVCIAIAIVSFVFTGKPKIDTSESAKNALKNKVSTSISAGTVLLAKDENAQAKDYTITNKSGAKDTKIWVWDYAAEDGDYVQVLVNGAPLGDSFMIKNKPKEFTVPAVGEVQIKGIRDGGGGITYAVRYDVNETSYFNGTPEGELNTYTLTNE